MVYYHVPGAKHKSGVHMMTMTQPSLLFSSVHLHTIVDGVILPGTQGSQKFLSEIFSFFAFLFVLFKEGGISDGYCHMFPISYYTYLCCYYGFHS